MSKSTTVVSNFRDLASDELTSSLDRIRDELFRLKLGLHTNQVTSTAAIGTKRRQIATINTILRSRELGLETHGASTTADTASAATKKSTKPTKAAATAEKAPKARAASKKKEA